MNKKLVQKKYGIIRRSTSVNPPVRMYIYIYTWRLEGDAMYVLFLCGNY